MEDTFFFRPKLKSLHLPRISSSTHYIFVLAFVSSSLIPSTKVSLQMLSLTLQQRFIEQYCKLLFSQLLFQFLLQLTCCFTHHYANLLLEFCKGTDNAIVTKPHASFLALALPEPSVFQTLLTDNFLKYSFPSVSVSQQPPRFPPASQAIFQSFFSDLFSSSLFFQFQFQGIPSQSSHSSQSHYVDHMN